MATFPTLGRYDHGDLRGHRFSSDGNMRSPTTALLASLSLLTATSAQGVWLQQSPTNSPPARAMFGMTEVTLQNQVLMFGGEDFEQGGSTFGDTWIWDGTDWSNPATPTAPGAREGASMTYDIIRDRAVMFAGWTGGAYLNETWEWDGSSWTLIPTANAPQACDWTALAFDLGNSEVVQFGGHDWQAPGGVLNATWTYDGTNWTQHAVSGPSGRWGHAMVYDPNSGSVLLFGGSNGGNETWSWDGSAWTQLFPATTPPERRFHSMAYDPTRNTVVMVSGDWSTGGLNDVWEWDGTDWTQNTASGGPPSGYYLHGMAYDPASQQMLHHGGSNVPNRGGSSNETWTWIGNATNFATFSTYGSGCGEGSGSSFYEQFDGANPFDMANTMGWTMLPGTSGDYVIVQGFQPIVPPTTNSLTFGDDQVQQITLPFSFPYGNGNSTTDVWVDSNGSVSFASQNSDFTPTVAEFLNQAPRVAPLWGDLSPNVGGTIHAEVDQSNPAVFHITFTGVPEFGVASNLSDFQVSLEQSGIIEVKYGQVMLSTSLIGYTPGGGSPDPGSIDVSTLTSFQLGNDLPAIGLRSQTGSRPVLGSTFTLEVTEIPPTATAAALLISIFQIDPGADLGGIGMPGCSLYVGDSVPAPLVINGSIGSIGLPLPAGSSLAGANIYLQGAVIGVPNVQPLPVATTNGGIMRPDVN